MWADLQQGILEEFVDRSVQPADQSFFDMEGFRLYGGKESEERKKDKKDSATKTLISARAALTCSECGTALSPPLKRGRRPVTCAGKCRLQRLYKQRAS